MLLGGILVVLTTMALVPAPVRAGLALAVPPLGLAATLVGIRLHRHRGIGWWLVAIMTTSWGGAAVATQLGYASTSIVDACVWTGQVAGGAFIALVFTRRTDGKEPKRPGQVYDLGVMLLVFGLGVLQLLGHTGGGELRAAAGIDVLVMAFLVRYLASRRSIPVAAWLLLSGAFLGLVFDILGTVQGVRMPPPGDELQVLWAAGVLLQGVAALHPSMNRVVGPDAVAPRRRSSAALLGLLPLVVIPLGLWTTAAAMGADPLPSWTYLVISCLVAGLCLLRATVVLRYGEHLAEHDPLTDELNQLGLDHRYRMLPMAGSPELYLLDLDCFQEVNDTHGHDAGDELLQQVAQRLRSVLSPGDQLARLGGDEFAVLRPRPLPAGRGPALEDLLLGAFTDPFVVQGSPVRVATSVGIAGTQPGTLLRAPFTELFTQADIALYAAKDAGGQRATRFESSLQTEILRRYTLQAEVRDLLLRHEPSAGHLEVHYQPLLDMASGEFTGAEALVRWQHPTRGLLYPDAFLDAVTDNALDAALDRSVLQVVVADMAAWRSQGAPERSVSVNLSRSSLENPDLATEILTTLADAGIPPHLVHVEITEHEQLETNGPAAASLAELAAAGITVDLDDYGIGYSSLDYLRRFPVHVLKLDRSVVQTVGSDDEALVSAVLAMAGALDLKVLAEGIETEDQHRRLVELGVDLGQGYLFSRPLSVRNYQQQFLGISEIGVDLAPGAPGAPGTPAVPVAAPPVAEGVVAGVVPEIDPEAPPAIALGA